MPAPTSTIGGTFGGYTIELVDGPLLAAVRDAGEPMDWVGEANSYTCPLGGDPGTGAVLMQRSAAALLQQGTLYDFKLFQANSTLTFKNMLVTGAVEVLPGKPEADESTFLVRFADKRATLGRIPVDDIRMNVRPGAGATSGGVAQTYYDDSRDVGPVDYTWARAAEVLWNKVGTSRIGAFPGLTFAPNGVPEGFDFRPVRWAWPALNALLYRVGCAIRYNPFTDIFTIVRVGLADAALAAAQAANKRNLSDPEIVVGRRANVPEKVRVVFNRRNMHSGTELDTIIDANQYTGAYLLHYEDVSPVAAIANTEPGSMAVIYDDMPALWDATAAGGAISNGAAITSRAAERAADYYRMLTDGMATAQNRRRTVYSGYLSEFIPGRQCKAVTWGDTGDGAMTAVVTGPGLWARTDSLGWMMDNLFPPIFQRPELTPLYPRQMHILEFTGPNINEPDAHPLPPFGVSYSYVSADGFGLYEVQVTTFDPDAGAFLGHQIARAQPTDAVEQVTKAGRIQQARLIAMNSRAIGRANGTTVAYDTGTYQLYVFDPHRTSPMFRLAGTWHDKIAELQFDPDDFARGTEYTGTGTPNEAGNLLMVTLGGSSYPAVSGHVFLPTEVRRGLIIAATDITPAADVTITLADLQQGLGTQGSETFTSGILTAFVQPT